MKIELIEMNSFKRELSVVVPWEDLKEDYDERFFRMWKYYLLSCAGCFRARINQLWQIVFSKRGIKLGYTSHR